MSSGSAALKSASSSTEPASFHIEAGKSSTPAGPAASTSDAPSSACARAPAFFGSRTARPPRGVLVVLRLEDAQAPVLGDGEAARAAVLPVAEAVGRDPGHRDVAAL